MKGSLVKILLISLVIASLVISSCVKIVVEPTGGQETVVSTEKQAIDTLVEFSMVNQLAVLTMLEIFSEDFTQPFFGENVVISDEDYEEMIALMEDLSSYEEPVMASLDIIVPEELASQHRMYACLVQPDYYMVPACGSPGIVDSFLGFFGYASKTGERSRNRIIECTKGLNEFEKRDLFDSLSSTEREGASNYNEWEQKLKNGELDDKATRIHQTFMTDPAYIGQAVEKKERPIDVVHKEGGQMVVKGGQFLSDAATTVVDTALPGFSKGVEIAQNTKDKVEKATKFVKKTYAGDFKGAIKEAATDKLDDVGMGKMGEVLGEKTSDVVVHVMKEKTGVEKPSDLVNLGLNYGQAKIKDSDKKSKPQLAVALNKDDNASIKMVTNVSDQDEPTLNLPEGGYVVVTADKDGNCDKDKDVAVVAGQETVVAVNTQGGDSTQTAKDKDKGQTDVLGDIVGDITKGLKDITAQDNKEDAPSESIADKLKPAIDTIKEINSAFFPEPNEGEEPAATDTGAQGTTGDTADTGEVQGSQEDTTSTVGVGSARQVLKATAQDLGFNSERIINENNDGVQSWTLCRNGVCPIGIIKCRSSQEAAGLVRPTAPIEGARNACTYYSFHSCRAVKCPSMIELDTYDIMFASGRYLFATEAYSFNQATQYAEALYANAVKYGLIGK